jgi:hypothetical protein
MRRTTGLLIVLAFCFALGAVVVPSHAAPLGVEAAGPPANDLFERAEKLEGSSTVTVEGDNTGATKEREPRREPDHAGDPGGASVKAANHRSFLIGTCMPPARIELAHAV